MDKKTVEQNTQNQTSEYWRSLDEKYQTPEFLKTLDNEFQSSPLKSEDGKDGLARRQFMKLMGASIALSATACVRRPVQKIIPYNKRPTDVIPGVANYYASCWFDGTQGLLTTVKTREGRPLYVKGNEGGPLNGKGLTTRASAHILSLYDPDRITSPIVNSVNPKKRRNSIAVKRTWDNIDEKVVAQLKKGDVRILTSSYPSPHTQQLMSSFTSKFGGKVYTWDAISTETVRKGQQIAYGRAVVPRYHYNKAKVIVSIDGDFLGSYLSSVEATKLFTEGRNPEGPMSRLIDFHSMPSLTTLNADDNYPIRASHQFGLAVALLKAVLSQQGTSMPEKVKQAALTEEQLGIPKGTLEQVAKYLVSHAGESLVVAGGMQTETSNALNLQLVVNWLNSALGNEGKTITTAHTYQGHDGSVSDIESLLKEIEGGKVKTLILHNVNPNYTLPSSYKFEELMNNVEMIISTGNWMDETTMLADIIAPSGHPMENWNEFEFVNGIKTIQQPTIRPLHDTRSFEDSLITWAEKSGQAISSSPSFYEHLKVKLGSNKKAWMDYLQKGFVGSDGSGGSARSFNATGVLSAISPEATEEGMELVLYSTPHLADGSMNNVSWLLELPDPVTKVCWDNYLAMSPNKAKQMHIKNGDLVKVTTDHHTVTIPAYVQPGMNDHVVAMAIGYGRSAGGELAKGVGQNAYPFAVNASKGITYSGLKVDVKKTSGFRELAITQGHHSMEGRQIVAETTFNAYKAGNNGIHRHKVFSIWGKHSYDGHKWGMAIDLNTCTGCSACVIACQSENNIPVVGRKYVLQGREMHWLRIDRYYKGSESNPDAVFQPVLCQHCENAPCETVCPVLATVHSDEGLNDMVYNRCVGTRYCSNNCPYKVRRFNWFFYGDHTKEPLNMALNPDVTVRTRGVMEKCTFCVQRIKEAKNTAADEDRPLRDGEIKTACQEVCPTDGIVFGDLNDKDSAVSQWFESNRQYTLLEEFNAAPRVRYLSKVRHTDRDLGGHHGDEHSPKGNHANEGHHS